MVTPKFDFFWQYVEHWSTVDPEFPSLRYEDRTITAREFNELTDQLAQAFISFGVNKGDRIATILPTSPEFVITFMAAGKVGAITVPLDVKFRIADIKRFLSQAEPAILISVEQSGENDIKEMLTELGSELKDVKLIMVGKSTLGTSLSDILEDKFDQEDALKSRKAKQNPDDGALIIYTGGTTGVPKSALLSHKNMATTAYIEYTNEYTHCEGLADRVKFVAPFPPSHLGGAVESIGTGIVGGCELILVKEWSPHGILELTQQEKAPWIIAVPTMLAIILTLPDLDKYDLSALRAVLVGGERLTNELIEGVRAKLCDTIVSAYGATEIGCATMTYPADMDKLAQGYVGKPCPGVKIRIVDDDENTLPANEVGEVVVTGAMTIKGYFKMPEEDKAGFTGDGWCKTGDLGWLAEDGALYIEGRKKQIIRVGSYTVLPTEIEEVVLTSPTIGLAAVIAVPHKIYGDEVWLFVIPEHGQTVDENEIIQMCRKKLAKFKVPRKVFIRENIPTTRIGKVDRIALREEVLESLK